MTRPLSLRPPGWGSPDRKGRLEMLVAAKAARPKPAKTKRQRAKAKT
jgi:hypothetical protein